MNTKILKGILCLGIILLVAYAFLMKYEYKDIEIDYSQTEVKAMPISNNDILVQHFAPEYNYCKQIFVQLATYMDTTRTGVVHLKLFDENDNLVILRTVENIKLKDNMYQNFEINCFLDANKEYYILLECDGVMDSAPAGVVAESGKLSRGCKNAVYNNITLQGNLNFKILYRGIGVDRLLGLLFLGVGAIVLVLCFPNKFMEQFEYSREENIDFLRIIACYMVIFNHSNERGFYRYLDVELGSFSFAVYLLCSILCKSAVPIFFMISGAMLLRKEESILATWRRIPKILVDLILFSIIYYWIDAFLMHSQFSLRDTLQAVLRDNYWHLWYLYAYIALIVTLPFLRKLVKGLDIKSFAYMYVIATFTMGVMPVIEYFCSPVNGNLKPLWIVNNIFVYPVLGYAINQLVDIKSIKKLHIILIWIVNILCIVTSEICEYYFLAREAGNRSEVFLCNFCIIYVTAIFLTSKYIFDKKKLNKITSFLISEGGKSTFGIYLLHILFLWKIPLFQDIWAAIESNGGGGIYILRFSFCGSRNNYRYIT